MSKGERPYHHGDLAAVLVTVATDIVVERGPEHVSVREVARRAGVSPGAPFRHFASRDALLGAVTGQAMRQLAEAAQRAQDARDDDPLRQIELIGMAYLDWAEANPAQFKIISQRDLVGLDPDATRLNTEIRLRMQNLLRKAQAMGHLRADADADAVLLSCRALVYGLARMFVDGHFPEWQPEGLPGDWMRKSLQQFIRDLRR